MSKVSSYSVQKFRGGYAIVWYEDGKRHRSKLKAVDRPSAEAEARQEFEAADTTVWTTGQIVEGYISHLAKRNPPSLQRRKDAWKAMASYWENVLPDLIDEEMCREYRAQRLVSDSTAAYELRMLATALAWALIKGKIAERPHMWFPPKACYEVRYLERDEFERFFAAVKAPYARLFVEIGLYTLARPTAILELKWAQVDFERSQIVLNPPGRRQTAKKRPIVPMNDELRESLLKAYAARQSSWVIEKAGKPIRSVKKAFQAASQRSGVKATPYTLRHTGAVWAAEEGASMPELAQLMGHDDDRTTQRHYARFSPEYLSHIAEKVAKSRKRN